MTSNFMDHCVARHVENAIIIGANERQIARNERQIARNARMLKWWGWLIGPILREPQAELERQTERLREATERLRAADAEIAVIIEDGW